MKRHRFLSFSIDSTRSMFQQDPPSPLLEKYKEDHREYIKDKYGSQNFDTKFGRWLSIPKPSMSVVDEHTHLLQDIENAYICGNLYAALTGACCLGERIFNQIIMRVKESYRISPEYKIIYRKRTINDWDLGIEVLEKWKIIDGETKKKYRRLGKLRNESVHFQNKEQDLEKMSEEAIILINQIVSYLFELKKENDSIIWFEVPGELYLKKEAEKIPFIRAFYIPCAPLVGYKHKIASIEGLKMKVADKEAYLDKEISDEEFVRLRKAYTKKETGA